MHGGGIKSLGLTLSLIAAKEQRSFIYEKKPLNPPSRTPVQARPHPRSRKQGHNMDQIITPKSLYDPLRSRINRYAHLQGQQHENDLRAAMTAQVQQARDAGLTYEELAAIVRGFEAGQ